LEEVVSEKNQKYARNRGSEEAWELARGQPLKTEPEQNSEKVPLFS